MGHLARSAHARHRHDEARNRTARLDDEVDRVEDRVEGEAMVELKNAVSELDEAIPAG